MKIEIILENGTCLDFFDVKRYEYKTDEPKQHIIVDVDNLVFSYPDADVYQLIVLGGD